MCFDVNVLNSFFARVVSINRVDDRFFYIKVDFVIQHCLEARLYAADVEPDAIELLFDALFRLDIWNLLSELLKSLGNSSH